jgi:hypothetical protein
MEGNGMQECNVQIIAVTKIYDICHCAFPLKCDQITYPPTVKVGQVMTEIN